MKYDNDFMWIFVTKLIYILKDVTNRSIFEFEQKNEIDIDNVHVHI